MAKTIATVNVKMRFGLTDFSGYELTQGLTWELEENEVPQIEMDNVTQKIHEHMHSFAKPFLPFVKLSHVDPVTKLPPIHVQKLFMGVPLDED